MEAFPSWRSGSQSRYESYWTLQEGHQPWRSVLFVKIYKVVLFFLIYLFKSNVSAFITFFNVSILLSRLLWRWFECHNCICCVLHAWEQSTKLQIHNGQFIQVSPNDFHPSSMHYRASTNKGILFQVCHWHTGTPGCWELYDCLFKRGNVSEEDAICRLAPKVLSADR